MAVLDRPRRHVHRRRRAEARRLARHPQAALREPRAVPRRRHRRHPPPARREAGRADPGRADRGGEDGHHGRHQRAARAQGRAARCCSSRRASATSCASPTRTARASSTATSSCPSCSTRRWSRCPSAWARTATSCCALDEGEAWRELQGRARRGLPLGRDRVHARLPLSRSTRRAWPSWRGRRASAQVSASHVVSPLMKIVSRGDTTVVDAYLSPILRRYVDQVAGELPGARVMFMQSNGGLTDAHRFQGKDSILSGPAGGIVGMVRTVGGRGLRQDHRLRHGRHLHRRLALRGRARARVRDAGGGRAHARADDGDPHHRGGRRLDPALRRPAPARRARFGRRQPGARVLPARRPARGHRLQRDAGQDPARVLPEGVRPERRRGARCATSCARSSRRSPPRSRRPPASASRPKQLAEGYIAHRGREHGQRDQVHLGAARPRRDRVHARLLRRRGRAARLPGRRRRSA